MPVLAGRAVTYLLILIYPIEATLGTLQRAVEKGVLKQIAPV